MDSEQLRQVIAISRLGTISAAAREMHMTQPTLSRALKRTEQELGKGLGVDKSATRIEAPQRLLGTGHSIRARRGKHHFVVRNGIW